MRGAALLVLLAALVLSALAVALVLAPVVVGVLAVSCAAAVARRA